MDLDGMWNFRLDHGEAETEHWERGLPGDVERLYVPGSYNDQREDPEYRTHCGKAYYEREVTVPLGFKGQRLWLRFDAVTHDAVVYLDGQEIIRHRGGFLPFEVEITDYVKPGDTFRIVVSADNTIDHTTLPRGNEGGTPFFGSDNAQVPAVQAAKVHRGKVNLPNFDFFNYAGLNRHVRLYTTPKAYISDVSIVPELQDDEAIVHYLVKTDGDQVIAYSPCTVLSQNMSKVKDAEEKGIARENTFDNVSSIGQEDAHSKSDVDTIFFGEKRREAGDEELKQAKVEPFIKLRVQVLDAEGTVVGEGTEAEGSIVLKTPKRWWPYPGTPYLYRLSVLYGEDEYSEPFGIREVRVEGTRFLINGKPFYFKGAAKHEDFYLHGRGTDQLLNVKDVSLFHWLHANSFRTSHYPYAEEMYRLCDAEGIVIIDEAPAVGISAGGQNPYTEELMQYHKDVLQDLVERDKNHPSVVMWSLGNEPDTESHPEEAFRYWRALYDHVKGLDPEKRPVTFVCNQNNYERDLVTRTMDVVCINRYYGWYNLSGDLDSAVYAWNLELDFWEKQHKPVMVTEYGADTLPGLHGTVAEMWTEEFQREYYRRLDEEVFDKRPFFIGEQCWCFADFGTLQGVYRADGNRKGIFTRERRPKLAAHYLRERWEKIPNFGYKSGEETKH